MVENGGWPMMLAKAYVLRRTGSGETEESYLRDKEHDLYEGRWQEITGIYKQVLLLKFNADYSGWKCSSTNSVVSSLEAVHLHFSIASVAAFASKGWPPTNLVEVERPLTPIVTNTLTTVQIQVLCGGSGPSLN
jgi:hypothetical protein